MRFRAELETNGQTATGIEVPAAVLEQQRWFVEGIESAKKPETRARRVVAAVERLREGRGQR